MQNENFVLLGIDFNDQKKKKKNEKKKEEDRRKTNLRGLHGTTDNTCS